MRRSHRRGTGSGSADGAHALSVRGTRSGGAIGSLGARRTRTLSVYGTSRRGTGSSSAGGALAPSVLGTRSRSRIAATARYRLSRRRHTCGSLGSVE